MTYKDKTQNEIRAQAQKLRKKGVSLKEIANTLGVSVSTAYAYCKGVLPAGYKKADLRRDALMPKFIELYQQGTPIPTIAEKLGVPAPTLFDWRRRTGIKKNSRRTYVTDKLRDSIRKKMSRDPDGKMRKEAVRLYQEEQFSTPEIAEKLGVTSVTIGQWLAQEGIERRKHPTRKTREKLRKANLGPKRYNWKGGITDKNVRIRTSLQMKLAREACFERDDYTCQSCDQRGGKLNAHHIWPFQRFSELQFEVNNLVTLCKECHDSFHKAAGGHVKVAIGPFFYGNKDRIKEERADYIVPRYPALRSVEAYETYSDSLAARTFRYRDGAGRHHSVHSAYLRWHGSRGTGRAPGLFFNPLSPLGERVRACPGLDPGVRG